jgi:gliding motility-associated-like protein
MNRIYFTKKIFRDSRANRHAFCLPPFAFCFLLSVFSLQAQISVQRMTGGIFPQQIVNEYFAAQGIQLSNAKYNNSTDEIITGRMATFVNGSAFSEFQFSEGIVLTTSAVDRHVPGPNLNDRTTWSTQPDFPPRDEMLQQLTTKPTSNNSFLEFDFVSVSSVVDFEYVFASSEYPYHTCSQYNDLFAFFVTGPDPSNPQKTVTRNAALIPGTNLPVSINTVNQGFPGDNAQNPHHCVPPNGSLAYSKYYRSNMPGNPSSPYHYFIGFNGFTKGLSARVRVIPNEKYTLKISLADVDGGGACSAVFLKKKGFLPFFYDLFGDIEGLSDAVEGCNRMTVRFYANSGNNASTEITVKTGGTAVEGVDYQPITGTYSMTSPETSLDVVINPVLDGVPKPDRSVILYTYSKFYDNNNAFLHDRRDTITVWIKDNDSIILKTPPIIEAPSCGPLNAHVTVEKVRGADNMEIIWIPQAGVGNPNSLETDLYVTKTTDYKIIAKDPYGCFSDTLQFTVNIVAQPKIWVTASPTSGCAPLTCDFHSEVTPADAHLVWKVDNKEVADSANLTYTFTVGGVHEVSLTAYEEPHCTTTVVKNIQVSHAAANLQIPVIDPLCEEQDIYIEIKDLNGTNPLQAQWIPDTGVADPASLATSIHAAQTTTYMVIVEDPEGCFNDTAYVHIIFDDCSPVEITIPNIFTPNGDGINDTFKPEIKNADRLTVYRFYIYNRWGRLIFSSEDYKAEWDGGTHPNGIYYCVIEYEDKNNKSGTFTTSLTLIR